MKSFTSLFSILLFLGLFLFTACSDDDPATQYTLTFDKKSIGVTGGMPILTNTAGVEVVLSTNCFRKTGYEFSGWAESSAGGVV